MVDIFVHLRCEGHVGISEVCNYHPVLQYCLEEVVKCLLYSNLFFVSIAALLFYFLTLSEVFLGFNVVGLKCHLWFLVYWLPHPTIFWILISLSNRPIHYVDDLGICDQLSRCRCEVWALFESITETLELLLCVVWEPELLVVSTNVCRRDVSAAGIYVGE